MFTGLTVKIVGFESASGKRLESASLVVQGPTRFGKRHTTDARWSADSVALTLDVHDAAFHGCGPLTVYICFFGLCWLTSRLSAGGNQVVPGLRGIVLGRSVWLARGRLKDGGREGI